MSEISLDNLSSEENDFKILVATDNHLGYGEKDSIRGEDSYITFEEILQHAVKNEVDFILLGGDLFHDANPTTNALNRCMKLLRMYTLGDKEINFEFLSDQNLNFYNSFNKSVNYEDPNINIGIPVFSIHGNHDDPSGFARLSSLDVLSTTGLINYFGKWVDLTKIIINPLMMKKGTNKLALYGLSYIHDTRLTRLFHDSKVTMPRPEDDTESWFNLMVVHQNRADRGPKNFLPEQILPDFLNLVIWGHEHDCRIIPEENADKNFFVVQPGSSVATSLSEGEAIEKFCGLLKIREGKFSLDPIKLETVRPFIFESIELCHNQAEIDAGDGDTSQNVQEFIKKKIDYLIEESKKLLTSHPRQPKVPLIRLRIYYTDESQMFNIIRFGQLYTDKVANSKDMLLFRKTKKVSKTDPTNFDKDKFNNVFNRQNVESNETNVEDIVHRYFDEVESSKQLKLFATESLTELCRRLYVHDDEDAAEKILSFYKEKLCDHMNKTFPREEDFPTEIEKFKETKSLQLYEPMLEMLDRRGEKNGTASSIKHLDDSDDSSTIGNKSNASAPKRGRRATTTADDDDDDDISMVQPVPKPSTSRGRGRGRGSRGGATTSRATKASKAELNVSVNKRQSSRTAQPTIQSSFSQSLRKGKANVVYDVSSDSD